ncbi:hypothetical protein CLAFUW4_02684 [Fulvia fulva]|uniref:Uncharacterized protein n=1 Tax=Passalora fulva TaxID=5499 RepID=A0A9Q8LA83_PASFU|nr:uncharacterized protein CLAFUR5_02674 [Fulvia fulva]KAK4631311.1 hypothetical protein CLAFUR4_02679 [Fulvia fulva]KAK4632875.1 hypothetical protein CLAFUR0_02681 [Fulvia fulva]UJO13669.1 hypothetical protein CLAFUR5_02674 [Fulvia fulva]WPV11056.1 hypothetical protein CLAFUW4_02684 [Fulvia fulva]WPV25749.1 hypothetical protein CLAFUW7_02683 [Fulvia fulva]
MAQTVKQEPMDDTYNDIGVSVAVDVNAFRPPPVRRNRAPTGGRTRLSGEVTDQAVTDGLPAGLVGRCYQTTVFVSSGQNFIEITHGLIDTGAMAIFISRAAVDQLGVATQSCPPKTFASSNNAYVTYQSYVRLTLHIGGVGRDVIAFVEEDNCIRHIILGIPAVELFDIKFEANYGPRCEKLWHVAEKNNRRIRYVLEQERSSAPRQVRTLDYQNGLRIATKRGKTPKEREASMKIMRAKANYKRIHGKYQHRVGGA